MPAPGHSKPLLPQGPYALTDRRLAGGRTHDYIVRHLLTAGIRLIQIREKNLAGTDEGRRLESETGLGIPALTPEAYRHSLRRCIELARESNAVLIVNDDPALAAELDADGVHVGQDDIPPRQARETVGPNRILGVSTHTRDQLLAAIREPVDYVAVGPVFGTTSKDSPYAPLGLEFVRWAAGILEKHALPIVCIGGIGLENIRDLMHAAPHCRPAVISALMTTGDIQAAAQRFLQTMKQADSGNDCAGTP